MSVKKSVAKKFLSLMLSMPFALPVMFSAATVVSAEQYKPFTTLGVIGSFNNWYGDVPMYDDDGDGIYEAEIDQTGDFEFKVRADSGWDYAWGAYEEDYDRTLYSQENLKATVKSGQKLVVRFDTTKVDDAAKASAGSAVNRTNFDFNTNGYKFWPVTYEIIGEGSEGWTTRDNYIYFDNTDLKWDNVYAYWWNSDCDRVFDFRNNDFGVTKVTDEESGSVYYEPVPSPGTKMDQVMSADGSMTDIWQLKVPFNANYIIFSSGKTDSQIYQGEIGYQTNQLSFFDQRNAGQIYSVDTSVSPDAGRGAQRTKYKYTVGEWSDYDGIFNSELISDTNPVNETTDEPVNYEGETTVRIHYLRRDGNYSSWDVWAWVENMDGCSYSFTDSGDASGAVATVTISEYTTSMGFVIRKPDWSEKETDSDRYVDLSSFAGGVVDVYCISGIREFKVDYNKVTVEQYKPFTTLGVIGGFSDWAEDVPMTDDDGDGIYEAEIDVVGTHEFLVRADGKWDDKWGAYDEDHDRTYNSSMNVMAIVNEGQKLIVRLDTTKVDDKAEANACSVVNDESFDFAKEGYKFWPVTCEIVDVNILPAQITLDKTELTIKEGESVTLNAVILPENATDKTIKWISSDIKIANISKGKVTGVSAGTARVAAVTSNGLKVRCNVTVTAADQLKNTSWVNAEKVQIGDDIRVTGAAEGGTGGYKYAYYFKRSTNKKWNKIGTEFGNASYAITIPKSAAEYDMKVVVKDSSGATAEKIFNVTSVESLPLTNISLLNYDNVKIGRTVTIAGRFVGGTKPCQYEFYFKRSINTKWNKLSYGNDKCTYAKFTPTKADRYDLKAVVIDSTGAKDIKTFTLSVVE